MWLIAVFVVFSYLLYRYYKFATFWLEKDVPSYTPFPVVGNVGKTMFSRQHIAHLLEDYYKAVPHRRYFGFYNGVLPVLMVKDPELIKKIAVKEFDTFPEHRAFVPEGVDSLWSSNLFAMRGGKRWQQMRATLSPAYTSSKMKMMFELIRECSKKVSEHYLKKEGVISLELKDMFMRYANDVIVTTAFGISCDSLKNPDNEFYSNGIDLAGFRGVKALKFFLFIIIPNIMKALRFKFISEKNSKFFKTVVNDALKYRRENSITRPDMLQLLMQAQNQKLDHDNESEDLSFAVVKEYVNNQKNTIRLTDDEITAQAIVFYFGGFDTSSTMLSHAAYELMVNPDAQAKLRKEVDTTLKECQGEITYEALMGMKYLDMVLTETLRKWPPFVLMDRKAAKPFTIEPERSDEKPLHLEIGQHILIPVYAIQRDPIYFQNPDKFEPERFSDENKHKITPFTYLPFGAGPRNCIGSRFALLQGKLILTELISKFEFVPIEKSQIPLILSKRNFNPVPDDGFWIGMQLRET